MYPVHIQKMRLKRFFILLMPLIIFYSLNAFAYPEVGNRVVFSVFVDSYRDGEIYHEEYKETFEIVFYDSLMDMYKVEHVIASRTTYSSTEIWVSGHDIETERHIVRHMLAECQMYGGQKDWVTVKAGTFESCVLNPESPEKDGLSWQGDILFGTIKEEYRSEIFDGYQEIKRELIELND